MPSGNAARRSVSDRLQAAHRHAAALPVALALQFLVGAHAQDLRRAALARRGWRAAHVVAAADEDLALARLIDARPEFARAALA